MGKLDEIHKQLGTSNDANGMPEVDPASIAVVKQETTKAVLDLAGTHEVLFASKEMYEEFRKAIQEEL